MNYILNNKYLISFFFLIYFLLGSYLSITNGITSDEYHEQNNWIINLSAAKEFIGGCDIIKEMFEKGELKEIFQNKKLI